MGSSEETHDARNLLKKIAIRMIPEYGMQLQIQFTTASSTSTSNFQLIRRHEHSGDKRHGKKGLKWVAAMESLLRDYPDNKSRGICYPKAVLRGISFLPWVRGHAFPPERVRFR